MALEAGRASSSASSSILQTTTSKSDQVVHRVYLKTVGVLAESRLTHHGNSKSGERKKDKWFNLVMPESDLHRSDLKLYQTISAYPSAAGPSTGIPPLLIAFILDVSDLPSGQALLWNRKGGKVSLDPGLGVQGKGKEKETRSGIVLERWIFRATTPLSDITSTSPQGAPQAYRLGIIHFRALYALIRLLPAYRLFRRLRRTNTGLKLGLKLWSPEGTINDGESIREAWDVMERDLIGMESGIEELATTQTEPEEDRLSYTFPTLDLFGLEYILDVEYRSEVDFHVEDMESVLSEKFVDMEEDWFKPTVARQRMDDEARSSASASAGSSVPTGHGLEMSGLERRLSSPAPIPSVSSTASPIPFRQAPASMGSFRGSLGRPGSMRVPSGLGTSKEGITPGSIGRTGILGEGLPFAPAVPTRSPAQAGTPEPPSPSGPLTSGAAITARRLSGHSIHPYSPSSSQLRPTASTQGPQPIRSTLGTSKPSSIGRTSSFLSQAGRSLTHAQLASINQRSSHPMATAGSMSPPIPGTSSNMSIPSPDLGTSGSPSTLSFTKQPLRSLTNRPPFASNTSSPFAPSSLDKDANLLQSSPGAPPHLIKRYSSYSARRDRVAGSPGSAIIGSQGSSGDGMSQPSSNTTHGMLRRTSMRTSYEQGLRRSMEASGTGSGSGSGSALATVVAEDSDDIEAFLKTLDALPQPPTVAAQAVQASRSRLPSFSSSLSTPPISSSPSHVDAGGSSSKGPIPSRTPTTRAQIDAQLRQMAGSFQQSIPMATERNPSLGRSSSYSRNAGPSIGLLSASRPLNAPRNASQPIPRAPASYRAAPISSSPDTTPSTQPPSLIPHAHTVVRKPSARSLPGSGTAQLQEDHTQQLRSAGIAIPHQPLHALSPQTTGGTTNDTTSTSNSGRSRRARGPVLLRGGFGDPRPGSYGYAKSSVSSSPSHSPSRDFGRLTLVQRERDQRAVPGAGTGYGERQAEEELDTWTRTAAGMGLTSAAMGTRHGYSGYPGIPHGSGVPRSDQDKSRARVGLGTAPGSYADSRAQGEGQSRDNRGRQGRGVKSEGEEEES